MTQSSTRVEGISFSDTGKAAVMSEDGEYRYRLSRCWDTTGDTVAFIMLNPSTADAEEDDPTLRRCIRFAQSWGYGSLTVGNLFALRSSDPDVLSGHPDPVGKKNDTYLLQIAENADRVVVAWGHRGGLRGRASDALNLLSCPLYAFGTTKDGHPLHPLYQPKDSELEPYSISGRSTES